MVETLQEFRSRNPHLAGFFAYLDRLNSESPRGKVLISVGLIEEQLRRVLLAFMCDGLSTKELVDGPTAPLGSLSARIAACHSLGLISEAEHGDLTIIRRIRNAFAHEMSASFEDQAIVQRCAALRMRAHDHGDVRIGPEGQFMTAVTSLILCLVNRPHYVGQRRLTPHTWPY
jgi:mannitol operon repressor